MQELIKNINQYYRQRGKRPVFQLDEASRLVIVSQAPGKQVDATGIPWNDASGRKLRSWLGVTDAEFYNKALFSIMPIDFCYPGKGPHGDLPPDRGCADMWHAQILARMKNKPLLLLIGSYAIKYYLGNRMKPSLAETIKEYDDYLPGFFPMVHPSPRNKNWLKKNSWFESENIPFLQHYVQDKIQH